MFKDLNLKKVYDSEQDDLLHDFYIPVLENTVKYKRITGYFSSSSLLLASKGIAALFESGGIYQLISSAVLSEDDYQAFKTGAITSKLLEEKINFDFSNLQTEIEKDHLKILSLLIFQKRLQIKIAIIPDGYAGIFHEKIGILEDEEGNRVTFSGSVNETGSGWRNNIEEFKVFRSWEDGEQEYQMRDNQKFLNYWNNTTKNFSVVDLPKAIEENLLEIKPDSEEIRQIITRLKRNDSEKKKSLRPYQQEAINKWIENDKKGIFEMATGTGKTVTALGVVQEVYDNKNEYCSIIVVPYVHLISQWMEDVRVQLEGALVVEAHGGARNWKSKLNQFLADYEDEFARKIVIITTYDTLSSDDFIEIFNRHISSRTYLLVADEVHNFGAKSYSKGMLDSIRYRLGLSATPTRWFDEEGTARVLEYFDKSVYSYNLKDAIVNGFLTPYEYYPKFIHMTDSEFDEYIEITRKIFRNSSGEPKFDEYMKLLSLKRSKIVRNSVEKYEALRELLKELQMNNQIDHLLIYCDSGGQLIQAQKIVNEMGLMNHKFTEMESKSERERILKEFDNGVYSCLVAVKCLDEGVNIPSIKTAIILASSTNPREYVQRRGRVLRRSPGKEKATIYDFVVLPPHAVDDPTIQKIEQKILKKELNRTQDFLDTALNKNFILKTLSGIMLKYKVFLD